VGRGWQPACQAPGAVRSGGTERLWVVSCMRRVASTRRQGAAEVRRRRLTNENREGARGRKWETLAVSASPTKGRRGRKLPRASRNSPKPARMNLNEGSSQTYLTARRIAPEVSRRHKGWWWGAVNRCPCFTRPVCARVQTPGGGVGYSAAATGGCR